MFAVIAVVAVLALYLRTLHFGLYWDDFDDLRPWTWADLGSTFVGQYQPWAREGIYFYRPLTSVYLATATALFGVNSVALHVIPLFTLSIAATLTGVFVHRDTGSRAAGAIGTLVYAVHPLTATAVGPWIANQYQGFLVIAVLSALLIWRRQTDTARRWSWPLTIALIAAAWLKEDGLMLGPALVIVHVLRATVTRDRPRPTRAGALSILGVTASLLLWRWMWLPSQFGYGWRDAMSMIANLSRSWRYALVWHMGAAPLAATLAIITATLLAVLLWQLIAHRREAPARLAVTGIALMFVMNLPLAFVSSENRWHVIGVSAVLVTTAALSALRRPLQWMAVALVAALFAAVATERINAFAPCSADSLRHYRWALTLPELPREMHAWLSTRDAACASGSFDAFTVPMRSMTWGQR